MAKKPEPRVICENKPNVQLIYDTLARIIGERYGCEITVKLTPKEAK